MNEGRKKHITLIALGMLSGSIIGFFIGYMVGFGTAVKAIAEIAGHFIEIDYATVKAALFQYEHHISNM